MNLEIERRFLVNHSDFVLPKVKKTIKQVYLFSDTNQVLRVRKIESDFFLTYKYKDSGIKRYEFEYPISSEDGSKLLTLSTGFIIEKDRYYHKVDNHLWEIDVFYGDNQGLVIAEIELNEECEKFSFPSWIGKEISTDEKYFNFNLSKKPFLKW